MFMVHVMTGIVIAVVSRVGVVRVRRVVGVRVGRVRQRCVAAVAVPGGRVLARPAVLPVVAAVHGAGPTRPPAHTQAATDILAKPRTATSPHSCALTTLPLLN